MVAVVAAWALGWAVAWGAPSTAEVPVEAAEAGEAADEAPARECPKPERVVVGAHLHNVQAVDLKFHTYELDAYVWFRWCDPEIDPSTTVEAVNASELWGHMVTPLYEEPEVLPDGSFYQVLHILGRFGHKMQLEDYPFDRQMVTLALEDGRLGTGSLVYVPDTEQPPTASPEFILPGYLVGDVGLTVEEVVWPTAFGDPRIAEREPYSRILVQVPLTRPLVSHLVQLFVPLLSVVVCAGLMFLLSPTWVDSRVGVGTTAMLTLVALQLTYNQDLPDVGYLMLMDKVYLASYGFVLAGLAVVVRATQLVELGKTEAASRLHRRGLRIASWVFIAVVIALVLEAAF